MGSRNRCGTHLFLAASARKMGEGYAFQKLIDAECISALPVVVLFFSGLLLVVRVLKREVRAFGGCLGMHRR